MLKLAVSVIYAPVAVQCVQIRAPAVGAGVDLELGLRRRHGSKSTPDIAAAAVVQRQKMGWRNLK